MDIQIDISGIEGIEKYLNSAPEKLLEGALAGVNIASGKMVEDAKAYVDSNNSVIKGDLRRSIHADKTNVDAFSIEGGISANVEHAVFVEMGTGRRGRESPSPPKTPDDELYHREDWAGMSAQPFMYPAYVNAQEEAPKIVKENIIKKLKE